MIFLFITWSTTGYSSLNVVQNNNNKILQWNSTNFHKKKKIKTRPSLDKLWKSPTLKLLDSSYTIVNIYFRLKLTKLILALSLRVVHLALLNCLKTKMTYDILQIKTSHWHIATYYRYLCTFFNSATFPNIADEYRYHFKKYCKAQCK